MAALCSKGLRDARLRRKYGRLVELKDKYDSPTSSESTRTSSPASRETQRANLRFAAFRTQCTLVPEEDKSWILRDTLSVYYIAATLPCWHIVWKSSWNDLSPPLTRSFSR